MHIDHDKDKLIKNNKQFHKWFYMYNFTEKRKIWNVYAYRFCISAECMEMLLKSWLLIVKLVHDAFSSFLASLCYKIKNGISWTFYGRGNPIFTLEVGVTGTVWKLGIFIQLYFTGWKTSNIKKSVGNA